MEKVNNTDRLHIFKNNKIIQTYMLMMKTFFSFDTLPINNVNGSSIRTL